MSANTKRVWIIASQQGKLNLGKAAYTQKGALSLAKELVTLRKQGAFKGQIEDCMREKSLQALFRREPSEVSKNKRLKLITVKTEDDKIKGKLSFYCRVLKVSQQAFVSIERTESSSGNISISR